MELATLRRARLATTLVEQVGASAYGTTVSVAVHDPSDVDAVQDWCLRTGNSVYAVHSDAVEVFVGPFPESAAGLAADRRPGYRLWLYTNMHCNLACDYCCVESSPRTAPELLELAVVRELLEQAADIGVQELYLTGGEPFLHPDIVEIVTLCAAARPTVVLTNGMLFRGSRLERLDAIPRSDVVLQVSVDSATPQRHDEHRGAGSWERAVSGVRTARSMGFRVRLATTVVAGATHEERAFADLCSSLEVDATDSIVRRVARQGSATEGILISRPTVVPEVCVTAGGIWWHPVAARDATMRVADSPLDLREAVASVTSEFLGYRRAGDILAASFPCA